MAVSHTSCWLTKTPFQIGLLLTLVVGIPFLIVMIILYIHFLSGTFNNESCKTLCCVINITEHLSKFQNRTRRSIVQNPLFDLRLNHNCTPTIGVLVENRYIDDHNGKKFICMVTFLSNEWAVTSNECLKNATSQTDLFVRMGSSSYRIGDGESAPIKRIEYVMPDLVAINFEQSSNTCLEHGKSHKQSSNICLGHLKIPSDDVPVELGHSYVSIEANTDLPLKKRYQSVELRRVNVMTQSNCSLELSDDIFCAKTIPYFNHNIGSPLIDINNEYLIGVELLTNRHQEVFYLNMSRYYSGLKRIGIIP